MAHHRFIARFEIIVAEPGPPSPQAPDPMPDDLTQALITEIKKANPKKGSMTYKVEKAEKK